MQKTLRIVKPADLKVDGELKYVERDHDPAFTVFVMTAEGLQQQNGVETLRVPMAIYDEAAVGACIADVKAEMDRLPPETEAKYTLDRTICLSEKRVGVAAFVPRAKQ